MDGFILVVITIFIISSITVGIVLSLIQTRKNKKYKDTLDKLEIEKNVIASTPIMPELSKLESYLNNEKINVMYNEWKERLESLRNNHIPKITDMLLEADYALSQMDYKGAMYKIAKLEMEIYKVRTSSEFLLTEIKNLTLSEERNRAAITGLKTKYRELYEQFNSSQNDFGSFAKVVSLQFENIAKRFEDFETAMDNNAYNEVSPLIGAIDEMLNHIKVVISEVPSIVLLATNVIPNKIKEINEIYNDMVSNGYPLDYLNVEYNIEEANKKISDILDKCKVLNLEDSLFELKVLVQYFDSLFEDFEKEKSTRNTYENTDKTFSERLEKTNHLVTEIFAGLDNIKNLYNLSDEDINELNEIKKQLKVLNQDYNTLKLHTNTNNFAYSKLTKEIENLLLKLSVIEENLDGMLESIGSMRDDELRARQQLEEIKQILKQSKNKLREYNLPIIPKSYIVELKEAQAAIREIVIELDKKPITIETLNTRVDTARDLVLKLYGKTNEMLKTAMFAEMAIVYGNRYRSNIEDLNKSLLIAEDSFFKGDYQNSLEITINSLNRIEPGIYDKLLKLYSNEKRES